MTGFEVYKLYLALKLHFTSETYDYFQYGGSAKAVSYTHLTLPTSDLV